MYFMKETKRISQSELHRMMAEQTMRENMGTVLQENCVQKQIDHNASNRMQDVLEAQHNVKVSSINKANYLANLKNSLVSECILKLYKDACAIPLTEANLNIAKNIVNKFVVENGAQNLINSFYTKNMLLSEMSTLCTKYYDRFVNECNDSEAREFSVDCEAKDDFYKELETIDTDDAAELIRTRVSDAINDFIDTNMVNKLEYEEILNAAQEKIDATQNESYIDQYASQARRKITEMQNKEDKNVFNCMVESLCERCIKDEALKERYMYNANFDMDKITEHTELIYTMLEMVNTTEMIPVNETFIDSYLKTL